MDKLGAEFFDHIRNKIDWKSVTRTVDRTITDMEKVNIALLVELNLNVATLNKLLMDLFDMDSNGAPKPEPNLVKCPNCTDFVTPNSLGYCPNCKFDLARYIKSDNYHLGKKT